MRIFLTVALFFSAIVAQAQTDAYLANLEALRATLQKTPSFKVQIKGKKLSSYNKLYERLAADTVAVQSDYEQFFKLSHLLFPIRDNHLGFRQSPRFSNFKDSVSINNYVASAEFLNYPGVRLNIDSLKSVLLQKPVESVEGIYHYGTSYRVGLFRSSDQEYLGVVVDSDVKRWKKGQIAIRLYQHEPGAFKAVYGHPEYKYLVVVYNV